MRKKINVRAYERRLRVIKRKLKKLNVRLDDPEECLDILERIVEKGRPVIRNLMWDTVDKYFHFLIQNMHFSDRKRYYRLMREYDRIDKEAETLNDSLLLEVRKSRDFQEISDIAYVKTVRVDTHSLKLAARGRY